MFFDKIKAVLLGVAAAALAGAISYLTDFDWSAIDPRWGVPVGGLVMAGLGILRKELTGYGAGVPKPDDAIPGGSPLPTGSIGEDA